MRARAKKLKLTQAAIGRELGVSTPTVCQWMAGKQQPTLAHARALRDLLGCRLLDVRDDR